TTPLAALIGTETPLRVDADGLRDRLADPTLAAALAAAGLDDPGDLAALYVAGGAALRSATAGVPLITDDRPRLEFTAPAGYFHQEALGRDALTWVAAHLDSGPGPIAGVPIPFAARAALLAAQLALVGGDRFAEARAYLDALAAAPGVRSVRV